MSATAINLGLVLAGCFALYRGGDWLIDGVKGIGARLGWSPALIGLLLVSVGTSAPELFVSAGAAMQGYGDIAVGNAIGSNIVNLTIVLGIGSVIAALPIGREMARRHIPVMLALSVVAVAFLADGHVGRLEALGLLVLAAAGLAWAIRRIDPDTAADTPVAQGSTGRYVLLTGLGVVALALGAEALIVGGSGLAAGFGVSEAVIALTVTSIGTGLPEIVATVMAVLRHEVDLAIANIVGSNIMNLGLVLGVSGLIVPLDAGGLGVPTFAYLLLLSVLLLIAGLRPGRVGRSVGTVLLVSYAMYIGLLLS